jgi:hypothetical protein
MSRARRFFFPVVWLLALLLVVEGGMVACERLGDLAECPNGSGQPLDPRAYPAQRQEQCDETNESTDTYDHMLRFYMVTLPADASGVRYLNLSHWNGPDELFLRFNANQADVDQLLAGLHAEPDHRSAADEAYPERSLLDEFHLDDWNFPEPASAYLVYTFGGDAASTRAEGWVIVDRSAPLHTVFLTSTV